MTPVVQQAGEPTEIALKALREIRSLGRNPWVSDEERVEKIMAICTAAIDDLASRPQQPQAETPLKDEQIRSAWDRTEALNEMADLLGGAEEWANGRDPQSVVSALKDYMAGVNRPPAALRQAFESYMRDRNCTDFRRDADEAGGYEDDEVSSHWVTWQRATKIARAFQPTGLLTRAIDLHEKAGMAWSDAEELALREHGISDEAIREVMGECTASRVLVEDEITSFVRSVLVHGSALLAHPNTGAHPPEAEPTGTTHELKTDPAVFDAVYRGAKTHEIRKHDREFRVGDTLLLRETEHMGSQMRAGFPLVYTGREVRRAISHILTGYGLQDGWCILSFAPEARADAGLPAWQPIETAPMDGTRFLAYRRGRIADAYRAPRDDCEMWVFGGESGAFENFPEVKPSHWMPLPLSPEAQEPKT